MHPDLEKLLDLQSKDLALKAVDTALAEVLEAETALDDRLKRLEKEGIDRTTILGQCPITPSCGMGSPTPDKSIAVLKLLREVSDRTQKTI